MSDAAVAAEVARADPERWRAAMTAPAAKRAGQMALYAFNLEIARAPYVTSEPMLAEIRLRWWSDALAEIGAGLPPRRHEIVAPLAEAIRSADLPLALFETMIAARGLDIEPAPFADRGALTAYLDGTAGALMELAARHLGAPEAALPVIRDYAGGAGLAAFLRAIPELRARGRDLLPKELAPPVLAEEGLARIAAARARRSLVPAKVLPALLPGVLAAPRLRRARRGLGLELSEFRARAGLLAVAVTGRW